MTISAQMTAFFAAPLSAGAGLARASRKTAIAGFGAAVLVTFGFGDAPAAASSLQVCWIDAKTRAPAPPLVPDGFHIASTNPKTRVTVGESDAGSYNIVRLPGGTWIDPKTGDSMGNLVPDGSSLSESKDHASGHGRDWVRVPCRHRPRHLK
jgi:hypothetical protein